MANVFEDLAFLELQNLSPRQWVAVPSSTAKPANKVVAVCLECGKKFHSLKAAKKAFFGPDGCPKCGGADIDAY
jgi:predicted transcriptional regulator